MSILKEEGLAAIAQPEATAKAVGPHEYFCVSAPIQERNGIYDGINTPNDCSGY